MGLRTMSEPNRGTITTDGPTPPGWPEREYQARRLDHDGFRGHRPCRDPRGAAARLPPASLARRCPRIRFEGERQDRVEARRALVAVRRGPRALHDRTGGGGELLLHGSLFADVEHGLWLGSTSCPRRPGVEALRPDHRDRPGLPPGRAGGRRAGAGVRGPGSFAPQG